MAENFDASSPGAQSTGEQASGPELSRQEARLKIDGFISNLRRFREDPTNIDLDSKFKTGGSIYNEYLNRNPKERPPEGKPGFLRDTIPSWIRTGQFSREEYLQLAIRFRSIFSKGECRGIFNTLSSEWLGWDQATKNRLIGILDASAPPSSFRDTEDADLFGGGYGRRSSRPGPDYWTRRQYRASARETSTGGGGGAPPNTGSERRPPQDRWERWRAAMGFKIFGRSLGDLMKEAAVSTTAGILIRLGLTSAGVGGAALAGIGGGALSGGKEWFSQINANWKKSVELKRNSSGLSAEEAARLKLNLKERLNGLKPTEKKKLAFAIGRGALFGELGFLIGSWDLVSGSAPAEAIKGVFSPVREAFKPVEEKFGEAGRWRESWQIPTLGAENIGESGAAKSAGEAAKTVTSIAGETLGGIQKEIGSRLPESEAPLRDKPFIGPVAEVAGGAAHNIGLKAHELTGLGVGEMPWGPKKAYIDLGQGIPKVEVPNNAQDWIKDLNNSNGDYQTIVSQEVGRNVGEVGKDLSYIEYGIQRALEAQGKTIADIDPITLDAMRNHLLHIMEAQANDAFNSHLEEAIKQNISLDEIRALGNKSYDLWLDSSALDELAKGAADLMQVHDQVNSITAEIAKSSAGWTVNPGESFVSALEHNGVDVNAIDKSQLRKLGVDVMLAANYDMLARSFNMTYPDIQFPIRFGEIPYLVDLAEKGDENALRRIKGAFAGKAVNLERFFPLAPGTIWDRIRELLAKLR